MSEPRGADSVLMGDAAEVDIRSPGSGLRSRRLLRLAGDDRLAQQIQRGNDAAFEVAFERHSPAILAFCRHMLGSREEAEDAVQHTFAAAYHDLQRRGEREIALKAWLFTIARNRCLSILRGRREVPLEADELPTAGLAEQVEQRAELRQLLADVRELPDEQRAALLLAEVGGLSQSDIGSVLDCEAARVKALVYRARSALVARREARELPCEQIREQLATLRGGSLRRTDLRLHLRECPGCRHYREQVREQRRMLSVALPVAPTLGLKSSVLAAVGIGGGAAAGGGAAIVGGATVAKVAAVTLIAAGGTAVVVEERDAGPRVDGGGNRVVAPAAPQQPAAAENAAGGGAAPAARDRSTTPAAPRSKRSGRGTQSAPGLLKPDVGRRHGTDAVRGKPEGTPGRGPIDTPPKQLPVRRGPPEAKVKPERAKPVAPPQDQKDLPRVKKEHPIRPEQAARPESAGPKLK
jgi:RNA polymerase sigma factor (sigma-70 family)